MAKKSRVEGLYYITHIDNIASILKDGVLSHKLVESKGVKFTPIYDADIVSNRQSRQVTDNKNLWDFANLYFQPRNPMLYRVLDERNKDEIAILEISPIVLNLPGVFVSIGNAASTLSDIFQAPEGMASIHKMWDTIDSDWWNSQDGSKRKIMAECLVPDSIPPQYIHSIYVANNKVAAKFRGQMPQSRANIIPEPHMFFQPSRRLHVANRLYLIDGDMFFSKMQTITISVNTVGIMGKGLASRAKYQFPDMYVFYQDLCRKRQLKMGRPYIYKREPSIEDDPFAVAETQWFLLFPTKRHWREESDIQGIEQGLIWLNENYQEEGIASLAVPALGCGLGGLQWREVGPLMCRYLSRFDIDVAVYLPREQEILDVQLSPQFLLRE
jgi:hypothetical protein